MKSFLHVAVLENFDYFVVEHVNYISNFKIVLPLFAGPCFNHLTMGYLCNGGGGGGGEKKRLSPEIQFLIVAAS